MSNTEKNSLSANNSTCKQRGRTTRAASQEPQTVQVIHQIIIPETPVGLIGEKVVYTEKYLKYNEKKGWGHTVVPLPECGYFTITKAVLEDYGRVTVALSPHPRNCSGSNGTHICIDHMKKYKKE